MDRAEPASVFKMMARCPHCHRCSACPHESVRSTGRGLATAVVLTLDELEGLAYCTPDLVVRERLLCAIALHDTDREQRIRDDLTFVSG